MKTTLIAVLALSACFSLPAFAKGKPICKTSVCTDLVAKFNAIEAQCKPMKDSELGDEKIRDRLNPLSDAAETYKKTLKSKPGDEKLVQKALDAAYSNCGFGPSEDEVY